LICSAAAGSGKTAVLVERIVRLLREGAEPSSFLVITFTNPAASEMKERIRSKLMDERDHPMIRYALDQMESMQISTIHSFCQQLIRNQFQLIGIDPKFTVCDEAIGKKLFHEAFTDACEKLKDTEEYHLLKKRFEADKTEQMVTDLNSFLMSLPDPFGWMRRMVDGIPVQPDPDHPWYQTLRKMTEEKLTLVQITLNRMEKMLAHPDAVESVREIWKKDVELFHVKQKEVSSSQIPVGKCDFKTFSTPRDLSDGQKEWKEKYLSLRNRFKEQMNEIVALVNMEENTPDEWKNMQESLCAFSKLTEKTNELFCQSKMNRALVDFSDMEQYAVKILSDPACRAQAQSLWRYVFVDECQDISAIQNRIIELLQCDDNHLFMVGDVKQSIYRFRLADPLLFLDRIRKADRPDHPESECIYLQTNFRSRNEILETTNIVFRDIMRESVTELDYTKREELNPGRKTEENVPVQIDMISAADEKMKWPELTARHIAAMVRDIIRTPYPGEKRNYEYRDCVILMPKISRHGPEIARILQEEEIPVFFDGDGEYYAQHEIQVMENLLEWIDNPFQDLPLISVLQNVPFSFTEEELSRIRIEAKDPKASFCDAFEECCRENREELGKRCRQVKEKHTQWQDLSETMRLGQFIWYLYRETGYYYLIGAENTGEIMRANLRMLADQAEQGEQRGILTLHQFLSHIRDQQNYGEAKAATLLGPQDNLVRMMSIHKSKGLQFPVVFCAGMDQGWSGSSKGETILHHANLGLCTKYRDENHRIARPTLATNLFNWQMEREQLAEHVRLLYVAMTRPQERLYLITTQETNPMWDLPAGDARILAAKNMTDWWLPVLRETEKSGFSTTYPQGWKPYEISVYEYNQQPKVEKDKNFHSFETWLESVLSGNDVDELWKDLPNDSTKETMIKKSVSALIRETRTKLMDDEEETAEKKRIPEQIARKLAGTQLQELPAFKREEGEISAAWRGTLTHRLLSQMDLDALRAGNPAAEVIQREKLRMIQNHIISESEAEIIDDDRIITFWNSEIGGRILRAKEVHREWNFNLRVSQPREMLLQGVIDCAFLEEDGWVVLDYKTDRVQTGDQLVEEYAPQIGWYARAIRELTGQTVKEAALYSLYLGSLIPVNLG